MKKRLVLGLLLIPSLLTSCKQETLRSDIAQFIASFSLNSAFEKYQEAGYVETTTVVENGVTSVETITFDFNVKNPDILEYNKTTINKVDDIEVDKTIEYVTFSDDEYTYHKNEETIPHFSIQSVYDLILKFFYEEVVLEGEYYVNGKYYGDIIKMNALYIQNLVTINQEDNELIYETSIKDYSSDDGEVVEVHETIVVDEIGVLKTNNLLMFNDNKSVTVEIETYYK